jgi:folylpolyglutamate synthase/dihydropteroate synthase
VFATRTANARALDPAELAAAAARHGFATRIAANVAEGCGAALAMPGEAPVLVTGSLFAVGEAMAVFGGAPGERL